MVTVLLDREGLSCKVDVFRQHVGSLEVGVDAEVALAKTNLGDDGAADLLGTEALFRDLQNRLQKVYGPLFDWSNA